MSKPLPHYTDEELLDELLSMTHVSYAYNDLLAEVDRRAANRQARAVWALSIVSIGIALGALLVTALKA